MHNSLRRLLEDLQLNPETPPDAEAWRRLLNRLSQSYDQPVEQTAAINLHDTLRSLGEGICILDGRGRLQFLNKQAEKLFGWTKDEIAVLDAHFMRLIEVRDPYIKSDSLTEIESLLQSGHRYRNHYSRFRNKAGEIFPVSYVLDPVMREGELASITLVFQDVSQREREEEALKAQLNQTMLLNRVIATTSNTQAVEEVLKVICTELARTFDVPFAHCAILDDAGEVLTVVVEYVRSGEGFLQGTRYYLPEHSGYQYVIEQQSPLMVPNAAEDERFKNDTAIQTHGIISKLVLPLLTRKDVVGILCLQDYQDREFRIEEIALAQNIAAAASQAIENAQLTAVLQGELQERRRAEETLRQQKAYLEALHDTTLGLLDRFEPAALLKDIVARASGLSETEHGFLYVRSGEPDQMVMSAGTGLYADKLGDVLQRGIGLSGKAWEEERPLAVDNYTDWLGEVSRFGELYACVSIPLRSEDKILGIIGLSHIEPDKLFDETQIAILDRFAKLAALTLDNALLYQASQQELQERKKTQIELVAAKDEAEKANRVKSSFLASMSHELRTPLTAIVGYADLLYEDMEALNNPAMMRDIDHIRSAGQLLLEIINDILDLSKIEAGKVSIYTETFSINALIEDMAASVQPMIEQKGNTLVVEKEEPLGEMLSDITKLRQILFNLVGNAGKFTLDGTITLRVYGEHKPPEPPEVVFEIQDTGVGIPKEKIDTIFEPFIQAEESTLRRFGGTGLGLAITSRYCELMKGSISVKSKVDRGSTFTVRLPRRLYTDALSVTQKMNKVE